MEGTPPSPDPAHEARVGTVVREGEVRLRCGSIEDQLWNPARALDPEMGDRQSQPGGDRGYGESPSSLARVTALLRAQSTIAPDRIAAEFFIIHHRVNAIPIQLDAHVPASTSVTDGAL